MVGRALAVGLVAAAVVWPALLGVDVALRAAGKTTTLSTGIDAATYWLCHRRPERSFHTAGAQWRVCARCSGLYLAAPIGAIAAIRATRRRTPGGANRAGLIAVLAAVPTVVTLSLEWLHVASVSNMTRAIAALPLGAAIAFLIVRAARADAFDRVH